MSISEFPGLQIDDFRVINEAPLPRLCLLSHMHSDHLLGLERRTYQGPHVYCSKATRALVLNTRDNRGKGGLKYHHLRKESGGVEIMRGLDFDVPYELECGDSTLQVTLLDANHCPGAAMFLVQGHGKAVLFTGDVRCERWYLNTLRRHPALLPYTTRLPLTLYVDTTYEDHFDPLRSYTENHDGIEDLKHILKRYPMHYNLVLLGTTTGYEGVLQTLAHEFCTKVHMDDYWYHLYLAAADHSDQARGLLAVTTLDPAEARIHWCSKTIGGCPCRTMPTNIYFQPTVQLARHFVDAKNSQHRYPPHGLATDEVIFDATSEQSYVWTGSELLPIHVLFYFSRHASLPELRRLSDMFHSVKSVKSLSGRRVASLEPTPTESFVAAHSLSSISTVEDQQQRTVTWIPPQQVGSLILHRKQTFQPIQSKSLAMSRDGRHRRKKRRRQYSDSDSNSDSDSRGQALAFLNQQVELTRRSSGNVPLVSSFHEAAHDPMRIETQSDGDTQSMNTQSMTQTSETQPGTTNILLSREDKERESQSSLPSPPPEESLDLTPYKGISESEPKQNQNNYPDIQYGIFPHMTENQKLGLGSIQDGYPEPNEISRPEGISLEQQEIQGNVGKEPETLISIQKIHDLRQQCGPRSIRSSISHDVELEAQLRQNHNIWANLHFDWKSQLQ